MEYRTEIYRSISEDPIQHYAPYEIMLPEPDAFLQGYAILIAETGKISLSYFAEALMTANARLVHGNDCSIVELSYQFLQPVTPYQTVIMIAQTDEIQRYITASTNVYVNDILVGTVKAKFYARISKL